MLLLISIAYNHAIPTVETVEIVYEIEYDSHIFIWIWNEIIDEDLIQGKVNLKIHFLSSGVFSVCLISVLLI